MTPKESQRKHRLNRRIRLVPSKLHAGTKAQAYFRTHKSKVLRQKLSDISHRLQKKRATSGRRRRPEPRFGSAASTTATSKTCESATPRHCAGAPSSRPGANNAILIWTDTSLESAEFGRRCSIRVTCAGLHPHNFRMRSVQ